MVVSRSGADAHDERAACAEVTGGGDACFMFQHSVGHSALVTVGVCSEEKAVLASFG